MRRSYQILVRLVPEFKDKALLRSNMSKELYYKRVSTAGTLTLMLVHLSPHSSRPVPTRQEVMMSLFANSRLPSGSMRDPELLKANVLFPR